MDMTASSAELKPVVDWLLERAGPDLVLAAPLGLGKPHHLINAIYRRVESDPSLSLRLLTALSLTPPSARSDLERRFLDPFLARHFGEDFEPLAYVRAQRRGTLPANIMVEEFYLQSGDLLHAEPAQRHYVSLNYTHVARTVAERGVNVVLQWVAQRPGDRRLSLSCNPDLTLDVIDAVARLGRPRPVMLAAVHDQLPWLGGDAAVEPDYFDRVLPHDGHARRLFALPRQPVGDTDYAIGLQASRLVRDGGTLQIGIGALSDALCRALVLRQQDNPAYRSALAALDGPGPCAAVCSAWGATGRFERGVFGASEMITDGFQHLVQAGVIARPVYDDRALMQRDRDGTTTPGDREHLENAGHILEAAFFLGSTAFYQWLRELGDEQRARIGMNRVSRVNQLYGGSEQLEKLQRRDARFFNTAMMMTALGAATSDALEDGSVVSGVGGQYNFVAMAHALDDGRSVLMLRASRERGGRARSNILWSYGHTTIPRHLRDIVVTEYGIADLRGRNDEDCIKAMLAVTDVRFQDALIAKAVTAGKLSADFRPPESWLENRPDVLARRLAPFRNERQLPDYPMGSDFTVTEQRLVRALAWLRRSTASPAGKLRTVVAALRSKARGEDAAMERMGLSDPAGAREKLAARLVALALERS